MMGTDLALTYENSIENTKIHDPRILGKWFLLVYWTLSTSWDYVPPISLNWMLLVLSWLWEKFVWGLEGRRRWQPYAVKFCGHRMPLKVCRHCLWYASLAGWLARVGQSQKMQLYWVGPAWSFHRLWVLLICMFSQMGKVRVSWHWGANAGFSLSCGFHCLLALPSTHLAFLPNDMLSDSNFRSNSLSCTSLHARLYCGSPNLYTVCLILYLKWSFDLPWNSDYVCWLIEKAAMLITLYSLRIFYKLLKHIIWT